MTTIKPEDSLATQYSLPYLPIVSVSFTGYHGNISGKQTSEGLNCPKHNKLTLLPARLFTIHTLLEQPYSLHNLSLLLVAVLSVPDPDSRAKVAISCHFDWHPDKCQKQCLKTAGLQLAESMWSSGNFCAGLRCLHLFMHNWGIIIAHFIWQCNKRVTNSPSTCDTESDLHWVWDSD